MAAKTEYIERILSGDVRLAARLMRDIDDRMPLARDYLRALYRHTGRAQIIGVTGSPGVGKSTLVDKLIFALRAKGQRVGVVAVDPSSPFTGGAILGDRIRMSDHATDPEVFIRSVATRGALGGLSVSCLEMVRVLDAMGYDSILIETVGVGQAEVDIARSAHSCIVVTAPGLGDDVQAAKAGLLEIAQVFVVNKSDLPSAARAAQALELMVHTMPAQDELWRPPVVQTTASQGEGLSALVDALDAHRIWLQEQGAWQSYRARWARDEAIRLAREQVGTNLQRRYLELDHDGRLSEALISGERSPYELAQTLIEDTLRPAA